MRIRGPSGSAGARGTKGAGRAKGKSVGGAGFARMVGRVGAVESTEEMARQVRSALLEELLGVARELAETDDREGSTRRFVAAVIRDRFKGLRGKEAKRVEDAVSDLINRDEALAQRLHSQLKRLAKS